MEGIVVVTGSAGLIGSEAVKYYAGEGYEVVGVDNDMRQYFFGPAASTEGCLRQLQETMGASYQHYSVDIRDVAGLREVFEACGDRVELIVHTAAQPSHDWAAREPATDFGVNAVGTLNLLELAREHCPDAVFIFTSTNKVYGDRPNGLPLVELETRWELPQDHPYYLGIPEDFSIDQSLHSLFGASKVAADILVQEYGRYFGMRTGTFRGGCLTGPSHAGAELHGFLAYLMKCNVTGKPYTVYGYKGKQVRDNIHSADLIAAFDEFFQDPRPGAVYNIGGGRRSNCSMLEAIEICQAVSGRELKWSYANESRVGDHRWWISDVSQFKEDFPGWVMHYDVREILEEMFSVNKDLWAAGASSV